MNKHPESTTSSVSEESRGAAAVAETHKPVITPEQCGVQVFVPEGAPRWITQELMDDTWRTWQPYYRATLNMDDVLEIIMNVTKLADLL